ncbi:hypothetical protein GCM10023199_15760 [Actinomycetospora chibensis]
MLSRPDDIGFPEHPEGSRGEGRLHDREDRLGSGSLVLRTMTARVLQGPGDVGFTEQRERSLGPVFPEGRAPRSPAPGPAPPERAASGRYPRCVPRDPPRGEDA